MIRSHASDVDASHYVFDTGLDFGKELGARVLDLALRNLDIFPLRNNFNKVDDPREMIRLIGKIKTRELLRRAQQMRNRCPGELISFSQHFFPEDLGKQLVALAPEWVQNLSPGEPSPMLQISSEGNYLGTHKGHKRRVSLFMLLQGGGQETRWHRNTADFEVIDPLRIPDHEKIEHVVTAVMQPYRWYIFNHFEWHSVHNFARGSVRVSMGLDFNNVTAPELAELVKNH